MTDILKSLLFYMLMLSAFALMIFTFGCNTENPLCTDNYCVEGEIYPRSELVGDFSPLAVDDSVIFATLVGGVTPVETVETPVNPVQTPVGDSVSLADIVSDVASGGTRYSNKTVTFPAVVEFDSSGFTNNGFITLITNNRKVAFYVQSVEDPSKVASYQEGISYTFTVFVEQIGQPSEAFPSYSVLTTILENDGVLSVSLANLVSDAISGNRRYVNKVVRFTATVRNDSSVFTTSDTISLVTGNDNANFFVGNRTKHLTVMGKYRSGISYTFTVYIFDIKPSTIKGQNIWGRIVIE